jgi:hypothetical protein
VAIQEEPYKKVIIKISDEIFERFSIFTNEAYAGVTKLAREN